MILDFYRNSQSFVRFIHLFMNNTLIIVNKCVSFDFDFAYPGVVNIYTYVYALSNVLLRGRFVECCLFG